MFADPAQANREAPSLRFVKADSEQRARTTASLTATFAPATGMEAEVAAMLAAAAASSGKAVEEAEDALTEKACGCALPCSLTVS